MAGEEKVIEIETAPKAKPRIQGTLRESLLDREMAALQAEGGEPQNAPIPEAGALTQAEIEERAARGRTIAPERASDGVPSEDELTLMEREIAPPESKAAPDDGWSDLRKRFSPTQIEEMAARDANLRAAALNGTPSQAAEDRKAAEQALAETRILSERNRRFEAGLLQLAKANPDMAGEYLKTVAADVERYERQAPQNGVPPAGDEVTSLRQELAELKQNMHGFAYGVNSAAVRQEIYSQAAGKKIFQLADKMGELDQSVDQIVSKLVAKDRAAPGTINPLDSRSVRAALAPLIKEEEDRLSRRRRMILQHYIEERRGANARAPVSSRGPGAAARPADSARPKLSPFASSRDRMNAMVNDFKAVSRRPSSGTSAEIG